MSAIALKILSTIAINLLFLIGVDFRKIWRERPFVAVAAAIFALFTTYLALSPLVDRYFINEDNKSTFVGEIFTPAITSRISENEPVPEPVPVPVPEPASSRKNSTNYQLSGGRVFDSNSDMLTSHGEELLIQIILKIGDAPNTITIAGHTDSKGLEDYNIQLSKSRASTVAAYLGAMYPEAIIKVEAYGESQPLESNKTPEGRQSNRRVEIIVPK